MERPYCMDVNTHPPSCTHVLCKKNDDEMDVWMKKKSKLRNYNSEQQAYVLITFFLGTCVAVTFEWNRPVIIVWVIIVILQLWTVRISVFRYHKPYTGNESNRKTASFTYTDMSCRCKSQVKTELWQKWIIISVNICTTKGKAEYVGISDV